MNIMLGVEEQASMCDLNVTTPYSEVVKSEDEETLQDKTDIWDKYRENEVSRRLWGKETSDSR